MAKPMASRQQESVSPTRPFERLSTGALNHAAAGVVLPDYDRRKLDIGIVHFGPGAFHRAHQAFYVDRLLRGDGRWGICDVALRGSSVTQALSAQHGLYTIAELSEQPSYRVIGAMISLRSRISRTGTGDQAIFVRRNAFEAAGAFPPIALMEDIALCKRLKRVSRPLCLSERIVTSGRRWETNGVLATMVLMWRLRLAYFFGADPNELARQYGYE